MTGQAHILTCLVGNVLVLCCVVFDCFFVVVVWRFERTRVSSQCPLETALRQSAAAAAAAAARRLRASRATAGRTRRLSKLKH